MNFSEFLESLPDPLYEVKGEIPKCPPGYKWDTKTLRCLPKTEKDKITPNNNVDSSPENMPAFGVWGATGVDGDGYAMAEENKPVYTQKTEKEEAKEKETERKHKEQDDKMRYGKSGKPPEDELLPGEVKKFNKSTGKWESNKR